ncbi:hypothetical protein GJAV_G00106730 [Gymnothorax javanicus]|nr:hypothetical protein GJAV_G00106730 [Gymnothorax javanicus]
MQLSVSIQEETGARRQVTTALTLPSTLPRFTCAIHGRAPMSGEDRCALHPIAERPVSATGESRFLKMAERTPWWRAFMTRKKASPGSKDQEDRPPHSTDSETQSAPDKSAPAARVSTQPAALKEELSSSGISSGDPFDDARLEPLFNEQTCRRNLKVSRSGRFKEKRRVRASLPEDYQDETAQRKDENPR